jgi:hypothetical protein
MARILLFRHRADPGASFQGNPMKIPAFLAIALAMSVSTFAQTAPPAAPPLTAGAEFKGLRFDWDTVSGATWYQLEYRAHQTGAFIQQGDDFPATATSTHFSFPLHLFDWTYARYRLAACNSAGCSRSAEVSVSDLRRDAVGYFKSSQPQNYGNFGYSTDLSPDGYTLVTTAPDEGGASSTQKGRIFVFRRGSDGQWRQRARLEARTDTTYNNYVELHVSVSASGNTLAVAIPYQVVGPPAAHRGVVDIYFWKNNVYTPTRLPPGDLVDIFSADLDDTGYFLAVRGNTATRTVTEIFKSTNGVWVKMATIDETDDNCSNVKISQDHKKVIATCRSGDPQGSARDFVRVLSGSNWSTRQEIELDRPILSDPHAYHEHTGFGFDRSGDTIAVQTRDESAFGDTSANVRLYHLNGSAWQLVTTLVPGNWNPDYDAGDFGHTVSISGDGHTMAIGQPGDYGRGLGPRAAPLLAGTKSTGGVYVYRLTDSWKLANMVKPNYVPSDGSLDFGTVTALSGTGKTLVVGAPDESSWAVGIGGDWANAGRARSGALFMY